MDDGNWGSKKASADREPNEINKFDHIYMADPEGATGERQCVRSRLAQEMEPFGNWSFSRDL